MKTVTRLLAPLLWLGLSATAPADLPQPLSLSIEGLRSNDGLLLICLSSKPAYFPDCSSDPERRRYIVPVARAEPVRLGPVPPGGYAIALIHDENGNRKLDSFAGIPREGIGFSRNPRLRFGPPKFEAARFVIGGAAVRQTVKMRYFL